MLMVFAEGGSASTDGGAVCGEVVLVNVDCVVLLQVVVHFLDQAGRGEMERDTKCD